jgi:hypothetical protein
MRCFACGARAVQHHHIVPKARLKTVHRSLSAAYRRGQGPRPWSKTGVLADERNLLPVCLKCHGKIEGASDMHVELAQVPAGFWTFVSEYGLDGELPRHLMEAVAA